jgi:putative phosphoesterase
VISDTHLPRGRRQLPEECVRCLATADLVIHAGDFSTAAVYAAIEDLCRGPLIAVHGNVDDAELRRRLPERTTAEIEGVQIGVIHDAGPARGRLDRLRRAFPEAAAVVFGHSHLPLSERREDFQIFNPGSPTERRRAPMRSMGIAEIRDSQVHFGHIDLP